MPSRHPVLLVIVVIIVCSGFLAVPANAAADRCDDYPIDGLSITPGENTPVSEVVIRANTALTDTDTFGNNPGEPYLQLDIDDEEVVQTAQVERDTEFQTTLRVPRSTVDSLAPGTHELTAILWDKDGDSIDETDYGNDDPICERRTSFTVEERVENGIKSVEIEPGLNSDKDQFASEFAVVVTATTVLDASDTAGNNPGEPYFQIEVDDEVVKTTDVVSRGEDKEYRIHLSEESLNGFQRGEYPIEVELWDKDGDEIDDTDFGNDDDIDEWMGLVRYEPSFTVRASRSSTIVSSPVTVQATGVGDNKLEWTVASQPGGGSIQLTRGPRGTATFRPMKPGTYTLVAEVDGGTASKTVEVTAEASQEYELLQQYAPFVHLAEGERYRPTRIEAFVNNAEFQDSVRPNVENPTVFDIANRDEDWELDLVGDTADFRRYQDEYPPTVYGSVHEDVEFRGDTYRAVTYWMFYVYDPKQRNEIAELFAHQSDVETLTILLNDSGPQTVVASQHFGGHRVEWSKLNTTNGRVDVFPARGAHSVYLRNTGKFDGSGILLQEQYLPGYDNTPEVLFEYSYTDLTGASTTYTPNGESGDNYELVTLSGEELWMSYRGAFGPREIMGSRAPAYRERWKDIGGWSEKVLTDESQLRARFVNPTVTASAEGLDAEVTVENAGGKPHRFWIHATAEPMDETRGDVQTVLEHSIRVGTGVERDVQLESSLPDTPGNWTVRVRLLAYHPDVSEPEDIFQEETVTESYRVDREQSEGRTAPTVTQVIAGKDGRVGTTEILLAIDHWSSGAPVPDTGGQPITTPTLLQLIDYWSTGEPIE